MSRVSEKSYFVYAVRGSSRTLQLAALWLRRRLRSFEQFVRACAFAPTHIGVRLLFVAMSALLIAASCPPRVRAYLEAIVRTSAANRLVSLILFGSAVTGGWRETISDVDLILVLPDD